MTKEERWKSNEDDRQVTQETLRHPMKTKSMRLMSGNTGQDTQGMRQLLVKTLFTLLSASLFWCGCGTPRVSQTRVSQDQLDGIRRAAEAVLPAGADVKVSTRNRGRSTADVVISAHLLEGHSEDEKSPYVRGDYGTHEKLTRLVRYRCARILRSIAAQEQIPPAEHLVIRARHGVRVTRSSAGGAPISLGADEAMTLYQVKTSIEEMRAPGWRDLTEEDVMQRWKLEQNIIPSLEFRAGF